MRLLYITLMLSSHHYTKHNRLLGIASSAQHQICPGPINRLSYVGITSQHDRSTKRNRDEGSVQKGIYSEYVMLAGSISYRELSLCINKAKRRNIFGEEETDDDGSNNTDTRWGGYDVDGEIKEHRDGAAVVSNANNDDAVLDGDLHKKRATSWVEEQQQQLKVEERNEERGEFGVDMTDEETNGLNEGISSKYIKKENRKGRKKKNAALENGSSLIEDDYPPAYCEWINDEGLAFETGDAAHKAFPDMPIVEVDDMDNRVGGANPYEDLGMPEPPVLQMGENYDDWPEIMGETAGMDDPSDAPWRLEAEEIIQNAVEASGLNCSDILWTFHKVEVTVRRSDLPYDDEESGYVDSHQLSTCIRVVNDALLAKEEKLQVLVRHELIVATPGSSEILTTDKEFKAFKGFDVVVVAGGPPSPNFRELRGRLVERTYDELIISQKGKSIRIPLVLVQEVRLPSAQIEDGDWLLSHDDDLSTQLVSNDELVVPSSDLEEGGILNIDDDDDQTSYPHVLHEEGLDEAFQEIFGHHNADEEDGNTADLSIVL